ncbi:PAS domain-containing sensor histidine kinase [Aquabacterium sp. OR-4]|uniref:PAS domain-containing sensor histidine kinase n=1 Tax=Aquabacterium sp. OR-4 TaxID=2978127 RepID=UPI0021B4A17C|nr:PAS domain-containing sensor histidine kinase [Aquabacterium sp. OR-4]MDT7833651.1 PAS domain-containing sensor histidine kinase [Aquabacterium sp. OR-4]
MTRALFGPDPLLARLSARVPGMMYACVLEADGRLHMPYVSDSVQRLYGLAPDTVRQDARLLLQRVHPHDLPALADAARHSARTGAPWHGRFRVHSDDGHWRWHEGQSQVERQTDGSAVWYGYIDDVTERLDHAELSQRLQRLQAAHQGLAGSLQRLAHELATPLVAVIGLVQLLLQHGELLARHIRERLERVLGAGQHMQTLVRDLGDLGALEGGHLAVHCAPLDLAAAAHEAHGLMQAVAVQRQLVLTVHTEGPCWVLADALRLRQVLLNLLGNAFKFTPAGGQVRLQLSAGASHATLAVHDSGPGMDAAQLAQLFVPFARLGAERRGIEGSGLGLALCRGLVEAMGGRIGVQSAPGQGTTLVVDLPRTLPPGVADASAGDAATAAPALNPPDRSPAPPAAAPLPAAHPPARPAQRAPA